MKRWFKGLKVSQKLALISLFFLLPDSVMLYLFITGINENIQFARLEQKGNEYLRPLEGLLEFIPQHGLLAARVLGGEASAREPLAKIQAQVDKAFAELAAVDSRIGQDLQFTDEGLAKRRREHCRVSTVRAEWEELKSRLSALRSDDCASRHQHLVADVRTMITHAGDLSNLILDPDLDSYYLMDATLLALPQTQDRLAAAMADGSDILMRPAASQAERQRQAIYATLLRDADLNRIRASLETALNEDPNFYGTSATLQARVRPALDEYAAAMETFIEMTVLLASPDQVQATVEDHLAAGAKARDASFKLWRIAVEELDRLLQRRIEAYQRRRSRSLLVAGMALMAAIGFVTFITRSISGPLRKQAAELQMTNETLQAEIAERNRNRGQLEAVIHAMQDGVMVFDTKGQAVLVNEAAARINGFASAAAMKKNLAFFAEIYELEDLAGKPVPVEQWPVSRILRGESVVNWELRGRRKDTGQEWFFSFSGGSVRDTQGAQILAVIITRDITERKRAEEELHTRHAELQAVNDYSPLGMARTDAQGRYAYVNPVMSRIVGLKPEETFADGWKNALHPDDRERIGKSWAEAVAAQREFASVHRFQHADGRVVWANVHAAPICQDQSLLGFVVTAEDVTERKRAEEELAQAQRSLVVASRHAGMAEVATGVLHNVGNVLNSVNVSATLLSDQLRKTPVADLSRVVALLREQGASLGAFFASDPRGPKVPEFLAQLADKFTRLHETQLKEVSSLQKNIEHIKDIVAMQQSYARVSGVTETVKLTDLVEDTLRMNAGAFQRHDVEVVRDFAPDLPPITTEKHKVLQILINLVRNAKYACDDAGRADKRVTVRVAHAAGRVRIAVADNGVGIPPENLTRIFNHGFTTKKDGHGFGLHSGANAAKEMGGSLTAHSDGLGQGAVFTLELPAETAQRQEAA